MKALCHMTYTIRMVRLRQFIEPGLGVSTYLDFGARLFSTQWSPYGAHILQGLLGTVLQGDFPIKYGPKTLKHP